MIRAQKISIHNILGVEDIEILPGDVTIFEGRNASGKSSRLDAIKSVLVGGKDATLKRNGATEGETVIVFDNGLIGRRTVNDTKTGGELTVIHPQYKKLGAARTVLDGLLDAVSIDPQRFMDGSDAERHAILTEALGIELTNERLAEAADMTVEQMAEITCTAKGLSALEMISHVRKFIAGMRQQSNKTVKEKRASVAQLTETLPADAGDGTEDWAATAEAERVAHQGYVDELRECLRKITGSVQKSEQAAADDYMELRRTKRRECDDRIKLIDKEFQDAVDEAGRERDQRIATARSRAATFEADDRTRLEPLVSSALLAKQGAETKAKAAAGLANTRTLIAQFAADADIEEGRASDLTDAIEGLDQLKGNLLDSVPIENMLVEDGQIFISGVPFPRLNRQAKVDVCVEVAKLRAKASGIGVVIFDNLECLDTEHQEAFIAKALRTDLQWFVGKVSDAPGVNVRIINREAA